MKYVFTLLLSIITFDCFAQHPNHKVWAFGIYGGLDFNTQPPTPFLSASLGWESFASQCDEQGQLLFYSNGEIAWNKQHNIMPNGNGLFGNQDGSTSQGVHIIPHPANPDQYYLLSLEGAETYQQGQASTNGRLFYSIIDMSLNNGLGDVVPGQKNIVVDSFFSEHVIVITTECKMWLVMHTALSGEFRCYEINEQGIDFANPVVSASGTPGVTYVRGEIAYDPPGKRIFLSTPILPLAVTGIFEMHDIDLSTGVVSNPRMINDQDIYYRLCTSPKGTKLYATGNESGTVVLNQYDLTQTTPQDFLNSKVQLHATSDFMQDMLIGPDSAIYGSPSNSANFLFRIGEPDEPGLACDFVFHAVNLATGAYSINGLPSPSVRSFTNSSQDTHHSHDSTICNAQLTLHVPDNSYDNYAWSTGDTGTSTLVTQPGVYWVTATSDCKKRVDTFHVTDFAFEPQVHDTTICFASAAVLTAPVALPSYLWSDGSTGSQITVTQPGTYWVFATDFCIETVDTFHVSFVDFNMSLPVDTVVCDAIAITPSVDIDGATYTWQDGSGKASYTASASGTYWVEVSKQGCRKADTMVVDNRGISVNLGNDTLLCEKITITLDVGNAGANYLWHDGSAGNTYTVNTAGTYSVLADNGACTATDSVSIGYEKCDCSFGVPTVFTPNADGKNDKFNPVIESSCPVSEYNFSIYNRFGECVFSAISPTEKWDGRYKGQLADVGTYMYMLQFTGAKGKKFIRKGDVTLVR